MTAVRLFAALLLLCGPVAAQDDAAALSEKGKQAMAAGRFSEAAGAYAELARRAPGNPGVLVNLGMALAMSGRDAEALPALEEAVRLQPDAYPGWMFLGGSHLRLGRPAQAAEALEKAHKLAPDDGQVRAMLAEAYTNLGRHRDALPHLRALVKTQPNDPTPLAMLVQAHEALAAEAFSTLQNLAPESAYMVRLLAQVRLEQKQYPSALYLYRLALERAPEMRGLHASIARLYRETDHEDWAAVEDQAEAALDEPDCGMPSLECDFRAGKLEKVGVSWSSNPEALFWRASANSRLAGEAFAKLEAMPVSARKHELLASLAAEQDRFAESAEHWKQALEHDPGNLAYKAAYATQLYLSRDLDQAQPLIEEFLAKAPDDPQWNFFLGDIHLQRLDAEAAVPLLKKAVAADPQLTAAHHALGRALMAVEKPEEALPHLEEARPIDVDGSLHYQLAQTYIRLGRRDDAREPLEISRRMQQAVQEQQAASQELEITAPPVP